MQAALDRKPNDANVTIFILSFRIIVSKCSHINEVCSDIVTYNSRGCRNPQGIRFRLRQDLFHASSRRECPWMLALPRKPDSHSTSENKRNVYHCVGALIYAKVVLTASHYVTGEIKGKVLKIRVGVWDTQRANSNLIKAGVCLMVSYNQTSRLAPSSPTLSS